MTSFKRFFAPSIRRRILAGFVIVAVLVLAMAAATFYQLSQVRTYSEQIIPDSTQIDHLQSLALATSALDADLERFLVIRGAEYRDSVLQDLTDMTSALDGIHTDAAIEEQELVQNARDIVTRIESEVNALLNAEAGSSATDVNQQIVTIYDDIDQVKQLQRNFSAEELAQLQAAATAQGRITSDVITQTIVLGFLVFLIVVIASLLINRIMRPIGTLTETATAIAAGDLNRTAPVESADEIGTLAQSFNSMTSQLRNLVTTLEDRVQARTAQLRASAEVSRSATSILDPEKLLKQVADLITERFGFYYTGVFVLDETSQQAVLRAATGEAGQVLLARDHHLPVDEKSMVGTAIITGHPKVALDVGQGAVRFANPLLPNTRSEIALPLRIGERNLGALDVQSEQAGAFDESNTEVLQTMADQIAVALFNAETFQRSEQQTNTMTLLNELSRALATATVLEDIARIVLPSVNRLMGQSHLAIVQKTTNPQILAFREFTSNPDQPVGDSESIQAEGSLIGECVARGAANYTPDLSGLADRYSDVGNFYQRGLRSSVILPLRVGERVLGTFNVSAEQTDAYTAEQINQLEQIASQLAVTVENLNLAEQTQQTLAELDAANRQLIGQAWEQYTRMTKLEAAEWRNGAWSVRDQRAAQRETSQALISATAPLTLPIKVRGTTIGEFHITAADARSTWDDEDMTFAQSLVDQVGQVLETARLLDETERTAQREKAVADAADKIHRSTDIESVLQSAVTELQRITGRRGISVQLGFGRAAPPGNRAPNGDTGGDR